jgi:antitoxin (DNA-binding transcriptional repressor) of toxin-antitoxin stability system
MATIDISELEQHPTEIIQRAKDGETIEVNEGGTVVARLTPPQEAMPVWNAHEETWTDLDALVQEISKYLPEHVDAVEAVREIRREV